MGDSKTCNPSEYIIIELGFASVGDHIPQDDIFHYRPLRNVISI